MGGGCPQPDILKLKCPQGFSKQLRKKIYAGDKDSLVITIERNKNVSCIHQITTGSVLSDKKRHLSKEPQAFQRRTPPSPKKRILVKKTKRIEKRGISRRRVGLTESIITNKLRAKTFYISDLDQFQRNGKEKLEMYNEKYVDYLKENW